MNSQVSVYYSAAANYPSSSQAIVSVTDNKPDANTFEKAESSLQKSDSLNNEEARAVLGRYEYQKGNVESALQVCEGLDISAAVPKIKISISEIIKPQRHSNFYAAPPFSINTVCLLLEAAYLKAKLLQNFGRYQEAAESCKVILDVIESTLPKGVPENLDADDKLQETLTNAVILLPLLYQLANLQQEAILSFRRALLHHWNLDKETTAKIQKQFAVFLLYSGVEEANRADINVQTDYSFIPENNIEEAFLLLMILIREACLTKIEWDPSVLDHLSFALSVNGGLGCLSKMLEELLPGVIENNELNLLLALCYYEQGDNLTALNSLKSLYENGNRNSGLALLLASKIYRENFMFTEGVTTAKRAIRVLNDKCEELTGVAYSFLGVSLSEYSKSETNQMADFERVSLEREAIEVLEKAGTLTKMVDSRILYELSLENADQRKLEAAFGYVNRLVDLEGGSHVNAWILLARILSAQKRFADGETVINAALDQTEKWDQVELLRTKAKLQLAQGRVKCATRTYTQILAILRVQCKSYGLPLEFGENRHRRLEVEIWNDLAKIYISLSQCHDAEECLLKSKAITNYSASSRHTFGLLNEAKGLYKQALKAYKHALDADPGHVPSLISMALVFSRLGGQSGAVSRSFLNEALRIDKMNSLAWYNLGLFLKDEGPMCLKEAADCFQAAGVLKETEPIEPFR